MSKVFYILSVFKGDLQALEDLTYEKRKEFLKRYQLPKELPVVSFHTEAGITPAVLATLSHVAHAELPLSTNQPTKVPVVMPLGAAMAACAQLLHMRYYDVVFGYVIVNMLKSPLVLCYMCHSRGSKYNLPLFIFKTRQLVKQLNLKNEFLKHFVNHIYFGFIYKYQF